MIDISDVNDFEFFEAEPKMLVIDSDPSILSTTTITIIPESLTKHNRYENMLLGVRMMYYMYYFISIFIDIIFMIIFIN